MENAFHFLRNFSFVPFLSLVLIQNSVIKLLFDIKYAFTWVSYHPTELNYNISAKISAHSKYGIVVSIFNKSHSFATECVVTLEVNAWSKMERFLVRSEEAFTSQVTDYQIFSNCMVTVLRCTRIWKFSHHNLEHHFHLCCAIQLIWS